MRTDDDPGNAAGRLSGMPTFCPLLTSSFSGLSAEGGRFRGGY